MKKFKNKYARRRYIIRKIGIVTMVSGFISAFLASCCEEIKFIALFGIIGIALMALGFVAVKFIEDIEEEIARKRNKKLGYERITY